MGVQTGFQADYFPTGEWPQVIEVKECEGYARSAARRWRPQKRGWNLGRKNVGSPARIRTSIHGSKGLKVAPGVLDRTPDTRARPHPRLLDVSFHTSRGHKTSARHTARTKPRTKLKRHVGSNPLKTFPLNLAAC